MTISSDVRDRLAKLFGMLGSEHDGEALNAVRLLRARMKRESVSFGDLAEIIRGGSVRTIERVLRPNPAGEIAGQILAKGGARVKPGERLFLQSILREQEMTGGNYNLSTAQANWLAVLEKEYCRRSGMPFIKPTKAGAPLPDEMLDEMGLSEPSPAPVSPDDDFERAAGAGRAHAAGGSAFAHHEKRERKPGQEMPAGDADWDDYI